MGHPGELDAIGHLHKLRTQAEFEKLQELWKRIKTLQGAFYALPKAGVVFGPLEKQKEFNLAASQRFGEVFHSCVEFVNEQALSIPKHIADAADKMLEIARDEFSCVMLYPDPFDSQLMQGVNPGGRREFLEARTKRLREYGEQVEKLEPLMRDYLSGKQEMMTI